MQQQLPQQPQHHQNQNEDEGHRTPTALPNSLPLTSRSVGSRQPNYHRSGTRAEKAVKRGSFQRWFSEHWVQQEFSNREGPDDGGGVSILRLGDASF